jgi:hypothetical protein
MLKQLGLFPEFDINLEDKLTYNYKVEVISLLELLLENGEINLLQDDISDSHVESLINYLRRSDE